MPTAKPVDFAQMTPQQKRAHDLLLPMAEVLNAMDTAFAHFSPLCDLTPQAARIQARSLWTDWWEPTPIAVPRVEETTATGADGPIPARLYDPMGPDRHPILFIHGGGFVIGDLDSHDMIARRLALFSGAPVLSIAYRLAPEHPYPAGLDDCVAAAMDLVGMGARLGFDGARYAITGDSAGGNLTLSTALRLRDGAGPCPAAIAPIYGCYEVTTEGPTHERYGCGSYLLSSADMDWFWRHYFAGAGSAGYQAPLAQSLAGLPPVYVVAAECDPLLDDSLALIRLLDAANQPHQARIFAGLVHAAPNMVGRLPLANHMIAEVGIWLAQHLRGG